MEYSYRTALEPAIRQRSAAQNAGLVLQRYVANPIKSDGWETEKRQLLKDVRAVLLGKDGGTSDRRAKDVRGLYRATCRRWHSTLPVGSIQKTVRVDGRLIVGLGDENVLETGIRLHRPYGVPIIPGSSLKGLASHYADQVWGGKQDDSPLPEEEAIRWQKEFRSETDDQDPLPCHHRLFGTQEAAGLVQFHDAWWIPDDYDLGLAIDVMTPHHTEYYGTHPGFDRPTDFDMPVPIPFLTANGSFSLVLSPAREPEVKSDAGHCDVAMKLLLEALDDWGVGGKTAAGYGYCAPADTLPSGLEVIVSIGEKGKSKNRYYKCQVFHGSRKPTEARTTGEVAQSIAEGTKFSARIHSDRTENGKRTIMVELIEQVAQ
jgi:CRISPR-associated protein Cmr6